MHLTQPLNAAPIFRYWKHFGAGLQRRMPWPKKWRYTWNAFINRQQPPDHTIPIDMLPPGSKVFEAEQLLSYSISEMPDEILNRQQQNIVYDHPWPFNAHIDHIRDQQPMYCYNINTRFYVPREDSLVLTNTLIQSDSLEAYPPLEPSGEHVEYMRRHYEWADEKDGVLVRLPRRREHPKINIYPKATYGPSKGRKESNILSAMSSYAQTLLAKHYYEQKNEDKLNEILNQRSLSYPHCRVPFQRDLDKKIDLDLFIDSMLISTKPLPQIEMEPNRTRQMAPLDIKPRTWKSLLEQSRYYSKSWSFSLPRNACPLTIQLNSHIKRDHRSPDEMLARSIIHAFGLASQFARLRALSRSTMSENLGSTTTGLHGSCVLDDPLSVAQVNQKDLLDAPVVLQTVGYDHHRREFHFMRYQLNSLNFDDNNLARVKNLAWHSGPISELDRALRYYLDFFSFDSSAAKRMLTNSSNEGTGAGGKAAFKEAMVQ